MIRDLICRLGFHEFGLSTVKEVAPDIFIARTACLHCPREMFGDPDQIHSTRFQPGELNKMDCPAASLSDCSATTSFPNYKYDYAIKSWPAFFSKMIAGEKKHDMRDKSERTYAVGDRILLQEYDPFGAGYTGRSAIFKITYITSNDTPCAMSSNALARDACILSVELVEAYL